MKQIHKSLRLKELISAHNSWLLPLVLSIVLITVYYWRAILDQKAFLESESSAKLLLNSLFVSKYWLALLSDEPAVKMIIATITPLLYLPAFIFYLIFGVSVDSAVISNIIWLVIFIFSIYNLIKINSSSKWAFIITLLLLSLLQFADLIADFNVNLPSIAIFASVLGIVLWLTKKPTLSKYLLLAFVLVAGNLLSLYLSFFLVIGVGIFLFICKPSKNNFNKKNRQALYILLVAGATYSLVHSYFLSRIFINPLDLLSIKNEYSFIYIFIVLLLSIPAVNLLKNRLGKKYFSLTLSAVVVIFISANIYAISQSTDEQICEIDKVVLAVPYQNHAYLEGGESTELNNYLLGYYLEKSGRTWSGESGNLNQGDYAVVHLNGSEKSSLFMLENIDQIEIVESINCINATSVVIVKNRL